jgi:hypothetical protein
VGVIGELWLNGGLVAVLLGMVMVGLLLRRVEHLYRIASATGGLSALPYGILIVALGLQLPITDVTGVLIFVIKYFVLTGAVVWIVRSRGTDAYQLYPAAS